MIQLHTAYLKWTPTPDITAGEQELAEPILAQMKHSNYISIPEILKRHFRYGPLIGWRESMAPKRKPG